jgi:hypothetical protein
MTAILDKEINKNNILKRKLLRKQQHRRLIMRKGIIKLVSRETEDYKNVNSNFLITYPNVFLFSLC